MKRQLGIVIAIILTIISVVITFASIAVIQAWFRIKKNGTEVVSKVVAVSYNKWSSPPDRIYRMEFTEQDGKTVTKDYTNYTTNTDRFNIGETVKMSINFNNYNDFWLYSDLKSKFAMTIIVCLTIYFLTFLSWFYRRQIQRAFDRDDIQLGD